MHTFFHGWRRKAGCVALLIACAMAGMWIRSRVRYEYFIVPLGSVSYGVTSMHGGLDFARMTELDSSPAYTSIYKSVELHIAPEDPFNGTPWDASFEFDWRWDWAGFHIGEGQYPSRRDQDFMIPYWAIVLPLTLLSARLLLSRPRQRQKPTAGA
jgi:hypothetical protein